MFNCLCFFFFFLETCRCHKRVTTNFLQFLPYVRINGTDQSKPFTVAALGGMMPATINDFVISCCRTCKLHGESYVDFNANGDGGPAWRRTKEGKFLIILP